MDIIDHNILGNHCDFDWSLSELCQSHRMSFVTGIDGRRAVPRLHNLREYDIMKCSCEIALGATIVRETC